TITMGNVGNGSLAHLTTIVLNQAAGVHFVPVPYKGGGPLSTDLMGGQVELGMASTAAQAQHVRNGKMRALVLTGDKRSPTMPEVPTLKEQGIDVSDRKSTRLNSSHRTISYAVFCLKKKTLRR